MAKRRNPKARPGICIECGKTAMNKNSHICTPCIRKEIVKGD